MSHLLVIDLPGGNDTDVLQAALDRGDSFVFLTSDLNLYLSQPRIKAFLDQAHELIEVKGFEWDEVLKAVLASNQKRALDAVLCLIEIRLLEASKIASALSLGYLNPESAVLLRDKFNVRARLAKHGIAQPPF